jgi:hypothetical protein
MRIVALIFIAIITLGIVFFVKRPEVLKDIWLWLVGFMGPILYLFKTIANYFKELYSKSSQSLIEKKKDLESRIHIPKI